MSSHTLAELAAGTPVQNWLLLGPFVVKTGEHFEREYLYERERILDIDYLAADGGETNVKPELGKSHAGGGLGPKTLTWQAHTNHVVWGVRISEPWIYETVQRNAVVYAATFIESDRDCLATVDAHHSGLKMWMNGQLICNEPYGVAKGLRIGMPTKVARLKKGTNVLLAKIRPGYICDGIEFCVHTVKVSPLATAAGVPVALGRIKPTPYYRGTPRPAAPGCRSRIAQYVQGRRDGQGVVEVERTEFRRQVRRRAGTRQGDAGTPFAGYSEKGRQSRNGRVQSDRGRAGRTKQYRIRIRRPAEARRADDGAVVVPLRHDLHAGAARLRHGRVRHHAVLLPVAPARTLSSSRPSPKSTT